MTRGEDNSSQDATPSSSRVAAAAQRLSARQTSDTRAARANTHDNNDSNNHPTGGDNEMPPPRGRRIRPVVGTAVTGSQNSAPATEEQRPAPSIGLDSLFVPADDDRQWDEPNEEMAETEDMLGWDAMGDQVRIESYHFLCLANEVEVFY